MADDKTPRDDDANTGGGATTDRGQRDTGMPGPDPDAAERVRTAGGPPGPGQAGGQAPPPGSPTDDATNAGPSS